MTKEFYMQLNNNLAALTTGYEKDAPNSIANLANAAALLGQFLPDINWVGFYLMDKGRLILGPFQGKPACREIEVGRGVCGTAVQYDDIMVVPNVHEFPGHIACDESSLSEIVIPVHKDGEIFGVLDIDSPLEARFAEEDRIGLWAFAKILESTL